MELEVTEIVPGELDVVADRRRHRVVIPAGVGIPGLDDEDLAAGIVRELLLRDEELTDVIDVSGLLRTRPQLLEAVARRAEQEG